jgi:hypothetical protein
MRSLIPRRRGLGPVIAALTIMLATSSASAQSPTPSPRADVSAAPSPSSTPFPWPTLPTWSEVPVPATFAPDGSPDAARTARGVRIELWLSTPEAAPGTWVQALVRATNTRTDDVWYWLAGCTAGTLVRVDLSSVTPMGVEQTGNAGVLKDIAISGHDNAIAGYGVLGQTFDDYDDVVADQSSGALVRPLAECVTPGNVRRLRAGATRTERFAWYAASLRAERAQPLPPGEVEVSVLWPYAGHGRRPRVDWSHQPRHDLVASAPLILTGDGPGTPSLPEMVDTALADPRYRAWVDPDPDPTDNDVTLGMWPCATIASPARWATMRGRAPNGFVEVSLGRDEAIDGHHLGVALLDAWTGELLDVVFE